MTVVVFLPNEIAVSNFHRPPAPQLILDTLSGWSHWDVRQINLTFTILFHIEGVTTHVYTVNPFPWNPRVPILLTWAFKEIQGKFFTM